MADVLLSSGRFPLAWDNAYVYCFISHGSGSVVFITDVYVRDFPEAVLTAVNAYWLATPKLQWIANPNSISWYARSGTEPKGITFRICPVTQPHRKHADGPYEFVSSRNIPPEELNNNLSQPLPPIPLTDKEIQWDVQEKFNYDRFEPREDTSIAQLAEHPAHIR